MASEDSEQVGSGFLAIHRLRDLDDPGQALMREMLAGLDELDAQRELLKVLLLGREHWVFSEERNDRFDQVLPPSNHVAIKVLTVVVVPPIGDYLAHPEEVLEQLQARNTLRALSHRELMRHLIAGPVAAPPRTASLADKAD